MAKKKHNDAKTRGAVNSVGKRPAISKTKEKNLESHTQAMGGGVSSQSSKPKPMKGEKPSTNEKNKNDDTQNKQREAMLKEFFASNEELDAVGAVALDMYQEQHGVMLRAAGVTEYLSFTLDNELFAVNIFHIKEIIKPPAITEVPRTEPVILGILSLRGTIAPVVDLRRRLGLKAAPVSRKSRILLVFLQQEMIGLLVDEVRHVVRLREEDIEPPPGVFDRTEAEHILGVGRQHGEMYTLLDLNSVIQIDKYLKVS